MFRWCWWFFFLYVWWCGVALCVLVVVVFVALCCVHGVVCVCFWRWCSCSCRVFFFVGVHGVLDGVSCVGVRGVLDAIRKRLYVFKKKQMFLFQEPLSSHSEPLKSSEKQQKATASHLKATFVFFNSKFVEDRGPALPSSRATGVQHFHFGGWKASVCSMFAVVSARASFFGRAGALVNCSICARVHRTKTSNTPIAAHKNHGHTHRGSQKSRTYPSRHSHCPIDAAYTSCGKLRQSLGSHLSWSLWRLGIPLSSGWEGIPSCRTHHVQGHGRLVAW